MHTDPRKDENRPLLYQKNEGDVVGTRVNGKEIRGTITWKDQGGWIYVNWSIGGSLPTYLRASQVYLIKKKGQ